MKFEEFKKEVNQKRRNGGWYQLIAIVEGKEVKLKGFKTWLQILKVDNMDCPSPMGLTVAAFNKHLERHCSNQGGQ